MSRDTDTGGLDALFGPAEREAAPEPQQPVAEKPPSRVAWIVRNVLLVAVATAVTVAGLRIAGVAVSLLIIVAAFVALRLLMLAVAAVAPPPPPPPQPRWSREESGDYHWGGGDSLRASVRRWEQRLDWSQTDADRFSRTLLPVLAELTDERLRLRHGITRGSDPARARELTGEPLWQLLADPGRRPPKRAELVSLVEALERI